MKAKFTACASGFPEPTAEWFKDGQLIKSDDRIHIEAETNGLLRLTIENIDEPDVGKYACRIFNQHGEDTCLADLIFDCK